MYVCVCVCARVCVCVRVCDNATLGASINGTVGKRQWNRSASGNGAVGQASMEL